jgi:hypothetical protein
MRLGKCERQPMAYVPTMDSKRNSAPPPFETIVRRMLNTPPAPRQSQKAKKKPAKAAAR